MENNKNVATIVSSNDHKDITTNSNSWQNKISEEYYYTRESQ
jgi:hypothetical protein